MVPDQILPLPHHCLLPRKPTQPMSNGPIGNLICPCDKATLVPLRAGTVFPRFSAKVTELRFAETCYGLVSKPHPPSLSFCEVIEWFSLMW